MTKETRSFDEWLTELHRVAVQSFGFTEETVFDTDSWRGFYDDGQTPYGALTEDISNA